MRPKACLSCTARGENRRLNPTSNVFPESLWAWIISFSSFSFKQRGFSTKTDRPAFNAEVTSSPWVECLVAIKIQLVFEDKLYI